MSTSVKTALLIAGLVIAYFLGRGVFGGPGSGEEEALVEDERFSVIAEEVPSQEWRDTLILRGRTEADRKVIVRAETSGTVAATPVEAGASVSEGDILCELQIDARAAALTEARAALKKAQLDYDAGAKLADEGFRSDTSVAALKAALDLASADVQKARIDLDRTKIKAPFDGVFDNRAAEKGDYLNAGQACGTIIQRDPFLVVGAISERDVAKIRIGDKGRASLATGEEIEGTVRFIAAAADPATRTFDVELEIPNAEGTLRDGVTAEFEVFASPRSAHFLPRSALTLNDEGQIGIRHANPDGIVQFARVNLIGEDNAGVWVTGLEGAPKVIVRGQDYVRAGQHVDVVSEDALSDTGSMEVSQQ
ncbi:MAG: efflux RND transporter periplasmic adaptor subunit [Pseudomonadota bacterium]